MAFPHSRAPNRSPPAPVASTVGVVPHAMAVGDCLHMCRLWCCDCCGKLGSMAVGPWGAANFCQFSVHMLCAHADGMKPQPCVQRLVYLLSRTIALSEWATVSTLAAVSSQPGIEVLLPFYLGASMANAIVIVRCWQMAAGIPVQ